MENGMLLWAIFTDKEGAEEHIQRAIDRYPKYEKIVEEPHKFPYQR